MASSKKKKPTNPLYVAMVKRYGKTTSRMKDKRKARGGSKNKQREYLDEEK